MAKEQKCHLYGFAWPPFKDTNHLKTFFLLHKRRWIFFVYSNEEDCAGRHLAFSSASKGSLCTSPSSNSSVIKYSFTTNTGSSTTVPAHHSHSSFQKYSTRIPLRILAAHGGKAPQQAPARAQALRRTCAARRGGVKSRSERALTSGENGVGNRRVYGLGKE